MGTGCYIFSPVWRGYMGSSTAAMAAIFLLRLCEYGTKKWQKDRTALNQILNLAVTLVRGLFEVLIEVAWFTLCAVLLPSLSKSGSCWILRRLCGRTTASQRCSISVSSLNSETTVCSTETGVLHGGGVLWKQMLHSTSFYSNPSEKVLYVGGLVQWYEYDLWRDLRVVFTGRAWRRSWRVVWYLFLIF